MEREGGTSTSERIGYGFRLCTSRRPADADLGALVSFFEREKDRFERDPKAARTFLGLPDPEPAGGEPESPAAAASLAMVANVLLNLDATLTRE
jgi:hypothetical protein